MAGKAGEGCGKKRQTFAQNYYHPPNPYFKFLPSPLYQLTTSICKTEVKVVRQYWRDLKDQQYMGEKV